MNNFSRKFALVGISIAVSLFLVEIVFRVYGRMSDVDFRLFAKELKNSDRLPETLFDNPLKAGAKVLATTSDFSVIYSVNSKGLRDKEYAYEKPPGIIRLAVFGDSFTFGEGIPYGKRFTDIAETNIPGIEVLNFGYPGAGLDMIASYVFREGLKYQPDYVVIMMNNLVTVRGNPDISDVLSDTGHFSSHQENILTKSADTAFLSRSDPFFGYKPNVLFRNSYAASFFYYKYLVYTLKKQMEYNDKSFWDGFSECRKSDQCDRATGVDLTQRTSELLNKISNMCSQNFCKTVIFNIDVDPLKYFEKAESGYTFIDFSHALQEEQHKYKLSFTYDQHYNEKTNYFLGKEVAKEIKKIINTNN